VPKLNLNASNLTNIIVTPTINTKQEFYPNIISGYRLVLSLKPAVGAKHFYERSAWYARGLNNSSHQISRLIARRSSSNFHPEGEKNKTDLNAYNDVTMNSMYCKRAYVQGLVATGTE
jgi:hypothetical protein